MKLTGILVFTYSLIGILAVSCNPRTSTSETQRSIDPDKFALELTDKSTNKKNFLEIKIIPGSPSMCVEDFEVNAHISDSRGIVRAASRDDAGRVVYNINLEDSINVAALNYRRLKANHDSQGMPIVFRARANPNSTIRRGYSYSITVDVLYRGSQHRETGSITLTARQDG